MIWGKKIRIKKIEENIKKNKKLNLFNDMPVVISYFMKIFIYIII
jgi:hypothetical protein